MSGEGLQDLRREAMTACTHVGSTPRHHYVYVDSHFTHSQPCGFVPAVWFGLVSYPARAWGCTVLLESGAVYRNLPIHALSFTKSPPEWTERDAQTWNCYGWAWTAHEYDYLRGLRCQAKADGRLHPGEYLFSVAPLFDGFSAYPEQAKEFTFVRLDNGRITAQPTNHAIFSDASFTSDAMKPTGLRRQVETYSAEK